MRHFLIEPHPRGVRIKGCPNEPVFATLSALVYQHSVIPIALPCKLVLPEPTTVYDANIDRIMSNLTSGVNGAINGTTGHRTLAAGEQLLVAGAACNVLYFVSIDTESLTGPQAVRKAVGEMLLRAASRVATVIHFKVSSKGITLTDNAHR